MPFRSLHPPANPQRVEAIVLHKGGNKEALQAEHLGVSLILLGGKEDADNLRKHLLIPAPNNNKDNIE